MASALVDHASPPVESPEKDALDRGEKIEDAGGANTPSSTGELTPKERAALTRRLLWKLDLR